MPDAIFKFNNIIYIVEHKHLKEGGGGQDKQLLEIIDLIKYSEDGVRYISYFDGMYFNSLINPKSTVKINTVKNDIINNLTKCPNNFFVNTMGFEKILKDFKK